jgi:hypothetical protein
MVVHPYAPRLAGSQMVSYIHPRVGFNPQGEYMITGQVVKKRIIITSEYYDENGKVSSKEVREEIEYENILGAQTPGWWQNPIISYTQRSDTGEIAVN